MNENSDLFKNTNNLQAILDSINSLPDAGGGGIIEELEDAEGMEF